MENHVNVSHVCKDCESTHNLSSSSKSVTFIHSLISGVMFVITALVLLFFSAIAGGVGIILVVLYFWSRNKKCPACGRYGLIPVSTPKGMDIMKRNGWIPN